MNSPLEPSDSFSHLLAGLVDDELTSDQVAALQQDLEQDVAVDAYVDYISLHALLQWRFATPLAADAAPPTASGSPTGAGSLTACAP